MFESLRIIGNAYISDGDSSLAKFAEKAAEVANQVKESEAADFNAREPMTILSQPVGAAISKSFVQGLGLPQLLHIVRLFGVMSAVIVIVSSLLMLAVVNYPKTLMQTKTKIVSALMAVLIICLILIFADITLSILSDAFLYNPAVGG